MMIPPFAHNNFVARCKKEKGRLFRKASSSSFFLAFIGWMSAALMAVLCRLKGRGKKGQKRGGVHVSFLLQGCRNRSSRRAAKLGKKAVFLLLLSVLSFFVEASHILLQLLLFLPPWEGLGVFIYFPLCLLSSYSGQRRLTKEWAF